MGAAKQSAPGIVAMEPGTKGRQRAAGGSVAGRWKTTITAKEPLSVWSISRADLKLAMRASKRRRCQMLERLPLNPRVYDASVDKAGIETFRIGEIIVQRSDLRTHSYVLLEGGVVAKHHDHVLKRYMPGDCLGESLSNKNDEDDKVLVCLIAITDCICAVIRRQPELAYHDGFMTKSKFAEKSLLR